MTALPKFDSCIVVPINWGDGTAVLLKSEIVGFSSDDSSSYNIHLKGSPPVLVWDDRPMDRIASIISDLGWS